MVANGGNMKSWAFWNTNLSVYYAVYLLLNHSYLPLSAQFFILRVVASTSFFCSICQCVGTGILFDKFWSFGEFFERLGNVYDCETLTIPSLIILYQLHFNNYFYQVLLPSRSRRVTGCLAIFCSSLFAQVSTCTRPLKPYCNQVVWRRVVIC